MLSTLVFIAVTFLLQPCAAQSPNPSNWISAATLFTGGPAPVVNTGYAKYQGIQDDNTQTSNYLGMPYATAERFNHAVLYNTSSDTVQDARDYGDACPQHELVSELAPSDGGLSSIAGLLESLPIAQTIQKQSEDCLFINVQRPQNMTSNEKLPVLVWIHGGGFEAGASSALISEQTALPGIFYQGANIVHRSIEMNQPIIATSINYRLNHFGFSASRELEQAGLLNLGFEDQRIGLQWIQENIAAFGGDPSKVTIMGESAGSWSVSGHLVANNGNNDGLFRGAIGISGGPVKVDGPERQQSTFDDLVNFVDCGSASDKIACLRAAPYERIYQQMQTVNYFLGFRSLASAWTLRPDGKFFAASPDILAAEGKIANVPVMYGDMRDEGPLFSLVNQLNLTTTEEVINYFQTYWWPNSTAAQMNELFELYPQDPTQGSPFGTGLEYSVPLQYKRIAAVTGDYSFQVQRRALLDKVTAPKWNYLTEQAIPVPLLDGTPIGALGHSTTLTAIPVLGSFHASDVILNWFGTLPASISKNSYHLMGVLVSFVNNLDPNKHGMPDVPNWPNYDSQSRDTIHFQESGVNIIQDTYRAAQMDYINEIGDSLRI